jgi:hypothetical protein
VERAPVPSAPAKKAEPLANRLSDEDKRIKDLEARVREAEAQAAAPKPPLPPPPSEPDTPAALDDPAHPLAAARARLEPARKLTHRLSKEDFQFVLDEAERVLRGRPLNSDAKYFETYARGGLAYVAGKDAVASAALVEALTELRRHKKRDAHPFRSLLLRPDGTISQPSGWELALGYGDARGEAMGLIEKELQENPRSARALKARAYLRRMQGLDEGSPADGTRRRLSRRPPPG